MVGNMCTLYVVRISVIGIFVTCRIVNQCHCQQTANYVICIQYPSFYLYVISVRAVTQNV